MAWALDLDGVVWLEDEPIEGAADAIATLRASGEHVGFVGLLRPKRTHVCFLTEV